MEYATLKSGVEMSASAKKKPVADDGSWEENEAKMFAFWAIVVATMAVIIAAVTLPALYTSAHYLRSEIAQEADFCRMQVRDFWHKALELRDGADDATRWIRKRDTAPQLERRKRGWLFGHFVPSADGTAGQYDNSASDPAAAAYGGVAAPAPSYGGASAGYDVPLVSAPSDTYGGGGSPPSGPALASPTDRFGIQVLREYGNIQPVSAPDDSYAAAPILSPAFPPSIAPPASAKATQAAPLRRQQPAGCGCQCQMGPPGPPGPPGDDGTDGEDGAAGASGDVGRDGTVIALLRDAQKKPCVICPVGPPGVVGPQGPRGPTGPRGTNGISGIGGRRGEPGMQGPPGPAGAQGPIGPQGPKGVAGRKFMRDGTRGPVGKPGPPGPKGLPGCQGTPGGIVVGLQGPRGDAGRPGRDGHKGVQGPNGTPGAKGASGDCAHCPIPRTPPGY